MKSQSFSLEFAGKTLTAEFTDLTEQANGSVLLRLGETVILVTATMSDHESSLQYFPLSVEFEEKFYAAGAILGSRFQRREGRPSDEAILSARIVDRTIRPLFDQQLRRDIQVVITVLAMGEDDPDVLGVIGASLALGVSDIPWNGPVGAVRIGQRSHDGEILVNPSYAARADDRLSFEILACGKNGTINMIEASANEAREPNVMAVIEAASTLHSQIEQWQQSIVAAIGKKKIDYRVETVSDKVIDLYELSFKQELYDATFSNKAGKAHIYEVRDNFITALHESEIEITESTVKVWFEKKIDAVLHEGALTPHDGKAKRADGRAFDEVRDLYAKAGGISPVLHGSGIFYRGGTHMFSALTLGGPEAAQILDTIEDRDTKKRFMHHYNFPPYSVGETGRVGGFNRRMIGHGALAEKALRPMIPDQDTFPYTIRLVSETLSSNGSSSMGSVCASTLAMLDGGVPMKRPVAGIASGVLIEGDTYAVLTDIQGPEDEFGDMDLKVAGTTEGMTAIQMDVKIDGVPLHILREALDKARTARLHILKTMSAEISTHRESISDRAPEIVSMQINPEQIGLVIGSGGKTINGIKEDTGVEEISVEEDGRIFITGKNSSATKAKQAIESLTKTYEIGDLVTVEIVNLVNFGAFAKLDDYNEGLIHISEIAPFKIEDPSTILTEGETVDAIVVKVTNGKIGLSIKRVDPDFASRKKEAASKVKN